VFLKATIIVHFPRCHSDRVYPVTLRSVITLKVCNWLPLATWISIPA